MKLQPLSVLIAFKSVSVSVLWWARVCVYIYKDAEDLIMIRGKNYTNNKNNTNKKSKIGLQ